MDRYVGNIRRKAFEFVDNIDNLSSVGEIMDAMGSVLRHHGFDYFCCSFVAPTADERFEDIVLAAKFPDGWLRHYIESDYLDHDPAMRRCKVTARPFRWIKEAALDPSDPRAVEMVQRASDWGLQDGINVPVVSPAGRIGQVFFAGHEIDFAKDELPALHFMALYAFDRAVRLRGVPGVPQRVLTPREREVLTMVASGMTSQVIGDALHISARTVVEHIKNCCRKLGAANRTHAVMIAIRDRHIQP
jgi:DNA-binding CsgD family transcriptional regulator